VDLRRDLAITAAAAAATYGLGAMGSSAECAICGSNRVDAAARSAFRLESPAALRDARLASDWLVSLVMPAGALAASGIPALRTGSGRLLLEDGIVVAQAVLFAADLNTLAKGTLGRSRPDAAPGAVTGRSFYSSHTSRAFALAVATATVATMRRRRGARWLWIGGLALATGVGYLRLASDAHWLTDVAAGAVAGSAVGFSVPWFLHGERRGQRLELRPTPGGLAVAF
jgi:membrane-associated phospholipid phosphatase